MMNNLGLKKDNKPFNFYCVDDSGLMLKVMAKMLQEFDGNVIGSSVSSLNALESIKKDKDIIDVVTLDINMPEMNGLELLKEIKKEKPEIKVVMVSGVDDTEKMKETLKLGASHFIVKPFNKEKAFLTLKFVCGTVKN